MREYDPDLKRKHPRWFRFRYATLPRILWYATGRFIVEFIHDYWHVRIAKKPPYWSDASQDGCPRRFCRYCGKGSNPNNN